MTAPVNAPILTCHYWSIYDLEIEDACRWATAHHYQGMDLGSGDTGGGARLDPIAFARDPSVGDRLQRAAAETGIRYPDLFYAIPIATNDPDPDHQREAVALIREAAATASRIGVPLLTVSPGFIGAEPWEAAFDRSCASLRQWAAAARDMGAQLSVEAHVDSVANSPERAQALVEAVPGLALTLDYSHFICAGFSQASIEPLHPFAAHVHARQSRNGQLAAPVADGEIDFRRILSLLHRDGYRGAITIEYVSSPWQGQDQVDCPKENDVMRQQIAALIEEIWR